MIKYHLHENGWTVILDDIDFKTVTQDDVNEIAKLIAQNTCVVAHNQKLTVEDEMRVISMFKDPEPYVEPTDEDYKQCWVDGTDGIIQRVTGALNDHGYEGLAGFVDEMVWHCNQPYKRDRRPIVWLYGVSGTAGSRTSWNNNILTYNDLDEDTRRQLSELKFVPVTGLELDVNIIETTGVIIEDFTPSVVHTNNAGKTGLFFPFFQIHKFVGKTEEETQKIIEPIKEFTTQDKYCYHHDWKDGDLVLSEQWLGIHKRWPFEHIKTRLLHRAVFDFPEQDYS